MADQSTFPTAHDGDLRALVPAGTSPVSFEDYLQLVGDALSNIETTIGLEPAGIHADVAARIAAIEAELDSLSGGGPVTAASVTFDNTASGLTATNVQAALDEVKALVDAAGSGSGLPQDSVDGTGVFTTTADRGAVAFGKADYSGDISTGTSSGDFAAGFASDAGTIRAQGGGAMAHGYAKEGAILRAYATGAHAFGMSKAHATAVESRMDARHWGSAVVGTCDAGDGSTATMIALGKGSLVFGATLAPGPYGGKVSKIETGGYAQGAVAGGYAYGQFAAGAATSSIQADGRGSMAFGYAKEGTITALASGSVALGFAGVGETISATAASAAQLGAGTNDQATSLQAGGGVRINGEIPATPKNGDIWVDGSGNVVIRSGGISVIVA